ncbi:hypothetical protein KIH23_03190 [Flavobacterium sp. CYK-55]|uniref:DUF6929 family protein n=1 Tax=Flavobacterium sp. CYK-55 TaxID=2835529 RepID=UPI001BCDE745|nr:hypothetical protein [Flavobacterium sp. CYK-55]MBS7786290.1 hypothetical protein [Flavobacterium sp. CYK-55]
MTLEPFCQISGLRAASGIVFTQNSLFLISDSSQFLYRFDLQNQVLDKIALGTKAEENLPKKQKPDFEILTQHKGDLHLFGSGSKAHRNQQVMYAVDSGLYHTYNRSALYYELAQLAQIPEDDLNLEGAFFYQEQWYFCQRGNSKSQQNGIFICSQNFEPLRFQAIELPKIQKVQATFTDAVLVDDAAYFLAAAERTDSAYLDGEIAGSLIGKLNLKTFTVEYTHEISKSQKFEGIGLYQKSADKIEFLLCEDNDAEVSESVIYKLTLD